MAKYYNEDGELVPLTQEDLARMKEERIRKANRTREEYFEELRKKREEERAKKKARKEKKFAKIREKKEAKINLIMEMPNISLDLTEEEISEEHLTALKNTYLKQKKKYEELKNAAPKQGDFFDKYKLETNSPEIEDFFSDEDFMLEEELKNKEESQKNQNDSQQGKQRKVKTIYNLMVDSFEESLSPIVSTTKNKTVLENKENIDFDYQNGDAVFISKVKKYNRDKSFSSKFSSQVPILPLITPTIGIQYVKQSMYITYDKDTGIPFQAPDVKYDLPELYKRNYNMDLQLKKAKRDKKDREIITLDPIDEMDGDDIPPEIANKINAAMNEYLTREEYWYNVNNALAEMITTPSFMPFADFIEDPFWGDLVKNEAFKTASYRDKYFSKWIKEVSFNMWVKILDLPKYNKKIILSQAVTDRMNEWEQNVEAQRKKYLKTIPDEEKPKEILPTDEINSKMKISMPFSQLFCVTSISKCTDVEQEYANKYGYSIICCTNRQFFRCITNRNAYDYFFNDLPAHIKKDVDIFILEEQTIVPFFNAFFTKHISYEDSVDYAVANLLQYVDRHFKIY